MSKGKLSQKSPALYEGLVRALGAIDQQIAREMQRSPSERETQGVQKWKPIADRVEIAAALVIDAFNERAAELESIVVLAQAMTKALHLIAQDLGSEGLGEIRASYCAAAFRAVTDDAERALSVLDQPQLS